MATVSINQQHKKDFAHHLVSTIFKARMALIAAGFEGMGDEIYEILVPSTVEEALKGLPGHFVKHTSGFSTDVYVGGPERACLLTEEERALMSAVRSPLPTGEYSNNIQLGLKAQRVIGARLSRTGSFGLRQLELGDIKKSIQKGEFLVADKKTFRELEKFAGRFNKLADEGREILVEALKFYRDTLAVLSPIRNLKQLKENWPEVYDEFCAYNGLVEGSKALVIRPPETRNLNKMIEAYRKQAQPAEQKAA